MRHSLGRWRPRYLLLAWTAYWTGLALGTMWPAIAAGWRMAGQPNGHGSVSGGIADGIVSATITNSGKTVWAGSISLLTLSLLVTIPPLLLWLAWLVGSSRTNNADVSTLKAPARQSELYPRESRIGIVDTSISKRRARKET